MLIPHSHSWTRAQKWLVVGGALVAIVLSLAFVHHYERHHRGPTEALFFGTWAVTLTFTDMEVDGPPSDASLYYHFGSDHKYQLSLTPHALPVDDPQVLDSGTWYAGGDFIYLRLPWDQVSGTALVRWHIDAQSSDEVRLHFGTARAVFKRVAFVSPDASNQAMERTPTRRVFASCFAATLSLRSILALGGRRSSCSR